MAYWANNKAGTLQKIKAIHEESHEIYGAPKITVKLNQSGIKVNEKYVGNIMREMGIKAHYIKPYTITTKDEIYGAPKITVKLNQSGIKVNEKYVGNIMREMGIKAHYIKPYTITTKDCDFSTKLKNILKRNFNSEKPNSAWCTDITYIWTQEDGFVYLSSIMDL